MIPDFKIIRKGDTGVLILMNWDINSKVVVSIQSISDGLVAQQTGHGPADVLAIR